MGKKRRIIQRIEKFGKKYFAFLDGLDGTRDSKLSSSKIDPVVSKITAVDRGNQTVSLQFEAFGPGLAAQAAGLENDRVAYEIDGTVVNSNGWLDIATAEGSSPNNRDNYKTAASAPARAGAGASAVLLTPGKHTVSAYLVGEGAKKATATIIVKQGCLKGDLNTKTLTLNDGSGNTVFTISAAGALGDGADEELGLNNAANVDAISDALIAGINAHAIGITASDASGEAGDDADHAILLTQDTARAAGNTAIASTANAAKLVANAVNFDGGFDAVDTVRSKKLKKTFEIGRSQIKFAVAANYLTEAGADDGNFKIDLQKLTPSGKQPGVEADYSPTQAAAAGRHGYKISVVCTAASNPDAAALVGTTINCTGNVAEFAVNNGSGANNHNNILNAAFAESGTYDLEVRFTPVGSDNAALTQDTLLQTITVTKD